MYDQHTLSITAPPVVAVLPNAGGDLLVQMAIATAAGMLVWGIIYSLSRKAEVKA